MPINFTKPQTTDAYATLLQNINDAFIALGRMLDPATAGTLTSTPTGAKRLNVGLFEEFNGTSWNALTMGYPRNNGSGATGTWGISITGSAASATSATSASSVPWTGVSGKPALVSESFAEAATASTLAKRDANGYLYAAYLNVSQGVEDAIAVASVMTNTGGDGFMRKTSLARFGVVLGGVPVRAQKLFATWDGSAPSIGSNGDIVTARDANAGTVYFGTGGGKYLHNDGTNWQLQGGGNLRHNGRYYGNATTTGEVGIGALTFSTTAGARAGMVQGDIHVVY